MSLDGSTRAAREATCVAAVAVRPANPARRIPVDWLLVAALAFVVAWYALPTADGATSRGVQVGGSVASYVAARPTMTRGDTHIVFADMLVPGQRNTEESSGWRIRHSWGPGYRILISASTNPALQGRHAISGQADSTFDNFKDTGRPAPWNMDGYTRGVFGYSVSGPRNAIDRARWGSTSGGLKWRGAIPTKYEVADTGADTDVRMSLWFRTEIPVEQIQAEGAYRALMLMSVVPNT